MGKILAFGNIPSTTARRLLRTASLQPAAFLGDSERDAYVNTAFERGWPRTFKLDCLRRRGTWMCTVPPQLWRVDAESLSAEQEQDAIRVAEKSRRESYGAYGYHRTRDIVFVEGRWFYRACALSALRDHMTSSALALAIVNMLHAAEDPRQTLITHDKPEQEPEARVLPDGRRTRGPLWNEHDELVLKKWFGVHQYGPHKGKRASPTSEQWNLILGELSRKRSRLEVRCHLRVMNRRLRISLMVDGFLTREGVERYMREALGEGRIKLPQRRPRLKGRNYYDNGEQPMEGQPV